MHVLVVDDDRALSLFLEKGLRREGHQVDWVGDGNAALDRIGAEPLDLIVLDLTMSGRNGIQVLEATRQRPNDTSVLVLTARSQVDERVRCLNLGADDCLLKPFSFHELSARCRAILRRRQRFLSPVLRFAGIEMDRIARTAARDDQSLDLTAKEFALLEILLLRQGNLCHRAELLDEVWGLAAGTPTNIVEVYVNYLRRKLAGDSFEHSIIETVRGSGYRLRPRESSTGPSAESTTEIIHAD